ncbi:MAG: carbonic anhydrase family protein [Epsilonproteobacteria bacterium]|nr:carbonic anhydrase family protein [Campylobacterota bacterium]
MTKKLLLSAALLASTLSHAEHSKEDIKLEHNKHAHTVHWSYEGEGAPENWAKIDKKFFMCKEGENQSPIDLKGFTESELPPITFNYKLVSTEILDNGHTEQVNVKEDSSITVDEIVFDLKQFHFHTPSENNINGKSFPLEAHFVHASKDGELAVVAVMFEEGVENEALKELWSVMPTEVGKHQAIDAKHLDSLLPKERDYYRFNGSLTTPPCTEGVRWLVMKKPVSLSKEQIETFKKVMHLHNNRPIQPTNARMILK